MYDLIWSSRAANTFKKLPGEIAETIKAVVDGLRENPRPAGAAKLAISPGYRLRCGSYRILYLVNDQKKQVKIDFIGHRREVYDRY
ncbi:MAG: type II toxin-antitoxin system RelE/ParE family toxin [Peptococcaceae bacterium]|nr:type II toxin-antitoxin system RelE/ParE family toxin [Peptococcaceae bacterium]